jgi:hypothetical protein
VPQKTPFAHPIQLQYSEKWEERNCFEMKSPFEVIYFCGDGLCGEGADISIKPTPTTYPPVALIKPKPSTDPLVQRAVDRSTLLRSACPVSAKSLIEMC